MEILNERLNHYLDDGKIYNHLNESATPMWMTYMDAFNSFLEQSGKRLDRYNTYDEMDRYPEIHLALDIISTEIFVFDPITNSPFLINSNGKIPEPVLSKIIKQFTNKLKLKETLPFAVRQSLKYGDSFYFLVKDKENKIAGLRRIDNKDIDFVEYDEIGIEPLSYYISKKKIDEAQMGSYLSFLKYQNLETASKVKLAEIASKTGDDFYIIPRNMMVRFMNRGQNSQFFPFGESYLEAIFPYWKKVSLLEDSLIIYRIVRAPERRVFYIDVGKAPAKIAEKVVMQTKDEIKRRRTAASQENQEMGIASSFNPLSMQEDYFFAQRSDGRGSRVETLPGACLSLDTKIPLLDGRELSLSEIIGEWENHKEKVNWVYSCNPLTGELVPGKITWAGVTRKNTTVMKITLDNGETVTCTPDHKFPIIDIGFVEAKDLVVGQSLIPFGKRSSSININECTQVFDVFKNDWVYTNSIIGGFFEHNISVDKIIGDKKELNVCLASKIKTLEILDCGVDVGTITVDGNEEIHNYHTFALSSGIFTNNSNLGEISDVNYFYKKLIAGMRIPSTYFNNESPPVWNDGKVGSALAEEARFGKWLTEIREQYLWDFKMLFLDFLKERGINMPPDDLEMHWKESINVAENQELDKMVQRQAVFTGFPMEQFSPQYLQKRVLGWSDEEIQENMTSMVKWQKFKDNNSLT